MKKYLGLTILVNLFFVTSHAKMTLEKPLELTIGNFDENRVYLKSEDGFTYVIDRKKLSLKKIIFGQKIQIHKMHVTKVNHP